MKRNGAFVRLLPDRGVNYKLSPDPSLGFKRGEIEISKKNSLKCTTYLTG
jgi:hypothetical protein